MNGVSPQRDHSAPAREAGRRGMRRLWRSTTGRFALLHLVLSLACVLPVLLYVYVQVDRILLADFARPLEFRQSHLEKHYREGGIPQLTTAVQSRAARADRDQTAVLLVDAQGRKLSGNLKAWPQGLAAPANWTPARLHREGETEPEAFLVRTTRFASGHRLLLGGLLDMRTDLHRSLLMALLAACALAIAIGILGSFAILRQLNRMVAAIGEVGQHVGAGNLRRRAATDGSGDPVDQLKVSLNAMLDQIEALVAEHRTLTDALAHDLRSPLTRIHIQVAGALAKSSTKRSDDDEALRFRAIAQEVAYVLHILEGALEISRAEAGIGRHNFEVFELAAMLRDMAEIYQPLAATAAMTIDVVCPSKLPMCGDRGLVARAVANLIDNALKYAADGGEIILDASLRGTDVHLCVTDRAQGIPADRYVEAVRKFGRLDGSRSTPGSGLGLTLVSAVASLHGGSFRLEDNRPGLRARMVLPAGITSKSVNKEHQR